MPTPLQVLLVEDKPAEAERVVGELRRAGFDPAWQRVRTEAQFAACLRPELDLILADYALPEFEATAALRLLRARGLDVPLIVLAASQGEEAAVACMKQGAADYLLKDRLARLGPAVTHALRERQLRAAQRRADQIQAVLFQIAQAANQTDNLGDLLRAIHRHLGALIDTANFYVALYDEASDRYTFPFVADEVEAGASFNPVQLRRSLTDYVRRTGAPLLVDEAVHRQLIERGEAELVGEQSPIWLGAPLKTARGVVGVVAVQSYRDPLAYTRKDLELLAFVSDHLALAIERTRAQDAARTQLRLAQTLQAMGALLTTQMSLGEVMERIFDLLAEVVAYDSVSVQLLEEDGRLDLAAGRGYPDLAAARRAARQVPPEAIRARWRNQRVMIVGDTKSDPRWIKTTGTEYIHSWIGAALIAKGRFVGVLSVDSAAPHAYDEALGETAAAFANQAAVAIENARLFQAEREQRELAEALRASGQALSANLNFNAVLDNLLEHAARVAPYDSGNLMLVEGGRTRTARQRGYERFGAEAVATVRGLSFEVAATANLRRMAESGRPLIIADVTADPAWVPVAATAHIRAWAGAPIMLDGRAIGFFSLDKTEPGFYRPAHAEGLAAFAGQAGLALENARLFTESQRRETELATLLEVARAVSSSLRLDEVLRVVAMFMVRTLDAARCILSTYEREEDQVRTLAAYLGSGKPDRAELNSAYRLDKYPATRRVLDTGEAAVVRVDDPAADPAEAALLRRDGYAAVLMTPLRAGGETVGLAELFIEEPQRQFRPGDTRLARALADQAGMAIQNARLYAAAQEELAERKRAEAVLQRRVQELVVLRAVALAGVEATSVDALIARVTEAISETLYPDNAGVLLLDEAAGALRVHPSYRIRPADWDAVLPLGRGVVGRALATGRPQRVDDVREDPDYVAVDADTRAELCVPLLAGERAIGAINVESARPAAFSEADERLLTTVAGQLATAIERLRLFEAGRRRVAAFTALHEINFQLSAQAHLPALLETILERAAALLEAQAGALFLLRPDGAVLELAARRHFGSSVQDALLALGEGLAGRVAQANAPLIVGNYREWPGRAPAFAAEDYGAAAAVPIRWQSRVIGVLTILDRAPDRFGPADLELISLFADQAAVAIENARLYAAARQELQERRQAEAQAAQTARQLAALSQMGQTVAASLDMAEVLDKVSLELQQLLGAEGISILLLAGAGELVFSAVHGSGAPGLAGRRVPIDGSVAGEVVRSGRPLLVGSPAEGGRIYRDIERVSEFHTQALLAAPLSLENEIIGVMEAVHSQPDAFKAEHLRLLEAAALWASLAIGNARRHESTRRLLRESEAMAAISRALNETLDLGRILKLIVDSAQQVIPRVERAVIHLVEEDQQTLIPAAVAGLEAELGEPEFTMRPGEGIAGRALVEGRVINVTDTRADPRFLRLGRAAHMRSLLVAPVASGARRLGTISVQGEAAGAFSADDERLLATLAGQAALALENARYFEAERRRAEEAEALQRVTQTLISRLNLPDVLAGMAEAIVKVANCQHVGVFLLEGGRLKLKARQGFSGMGTGSLLDQRLAADALRSGRPLLVGDLQAGQGEARPAAGGQSAIAVPLIRGERRLGVLYVRSEAARMLDHNDLDWLTNVGRQLSVAIENAELYADLERALRQEQTARAQLVQNEKLAAMGRLVASVAHELNNPLQAIQNALYLVGQESRLSAQARDDLQVALTEAGRMADLIARLRDTYRPTPGERFAPVALDAVIVEVHRLIATHLKHHNVAFTAAPDPTALRVHGSHDQLKQVLLNLCLNAVEAMPGGGRLTLGAQADGAEALVTVADTGVGIDAEAQANLFEPFYTTKQGGTGLGLAITYDIVRRHNGRIEVESRVGQGTTFKIWLPRRQEGDDDGAGIDH